MTTSSSRYSPEVQARAVRPVLEHEAESLFHRDTDHLAALLEDTLADRGKYDSAAAATHRRFQAEHTVAHRARQLAGHLAQAPSEAAAG